MDPYAAFPLEIRQNILERLDSLRDLQSLLISSQPFYEAYTGSRKLVRQRVFLNETLSCGSEVFYVGNRLITKLLAKDPYDGLILREALWPYLVASQHDEKFILLKNWSLDLATAHRLFGEEENAQAVDKATLRLLVKSTVEDPASSSDDDDEHEFECHTNIGNLMSWLNSAMFGFAQRLDHEHGAALCEEAWSYLIPGRPRLGHQIIGAISTLCHSSISNRSKHALAALIDKGWRYLRYSSVNERKDGSVCWRCLSCAQKLVTAGWEVGIPMETIVVHQKAIWETVPIRTHAFNSWARILTRKHKNSGRNLDAMLQVWARLCKTPDPSRFESFDLEWALKIAIEFQKQHPSDQARFLEFQASVLPLFPGKRVHDTWFSGRSLPMHTQRTKIF